MPHHHYGDMTCSLQNPAGLPMGAPKPLEHGTSVNQNLLDVQGICIDLLCLHALATADSITLRSRRAPFFGMNFSMVIALSTSLHAQHQQQVSLLG